MLVALAILLSWLSSLYFGLTCVETVACGPLLTGGWVLWLTWLYTGLFITAHDAMHGLVAPGWPIVNRLFGVVTTLFYACFSYSHLLEEHHRHHRSPASDDDPDFYHGGVFAWYFRFLGHYFKIRQLILMALFGFLLGEVVGIPFDRVFLFWALPAVMSSWQLFFFGTYLPHRVTDVPFLDRHRARSMRLPRWLALVTCFNFGAFHREHHLFPWVPWWLLHTYEVPDDP